MPIPPTFQSSDRALNEYLRYLSQYIGDLETKINQQELLIEVLKKGMSNVNPLNNNSPVSSDRSGFNNSNNLSGALNQRIGRLAQPQIPFAPIVIALPTKNDPQSQDGSLVVLESGVIEDDGLYQFDGRTALGGWTKRADLTPPIPESNFSVLEANTTPISVNGNTTSQQDLMSFNLPAGILSELGRITRITSKGIYSTNALNTNFIVQMRLGGTLICNLLLSTSPLGAVTTSGWRVFVELITHVAGNSGELEVGFWGFAPDQNAATVANVKIDAQSSTIAFDLTAALTLQVSVGFSIASSSNICSQRALFIESFIE